MKHTNKIRSDLNQSSPKEHVLNKSFTGCVPCLKEALKIDRQIDSRKLNEVKIDEIKKIVRSIFESSKNDTEKN